MAATTLPADFEFTDAEARAAIISDRYWTLVFGYGSLLADYSRALSVICADMLPIGFHGFKGAFEGRRFVLLFFDRNAENKTLIDCAGALLGANKLLSGDKDIGVPVFDDTPSAAVIDLLSVIDRWASESFHGSSIGRAPGC